LFIVSINISKNKGERKTPVEEANIGAGGIIGDAHADPDTHRQVSLLSVASVEKMKKMGVDVGHGDFAENLTISGIDPYTLPTGTRVIIGNNVVLEITQIGKDCHNKGCAIFRQVGKCVMPTEGVFTRVIKGGRIKAGDSLEIIKK
jgi:MOSC domain-containing protein YiiM